MEKSVGPVAQIYLIFATLSRKKIDRYARNISSSGVGKYNDNNSQATLWVEYGLIDFPITSVLNAIPLCPACHRQFDYHLDPGFLFIPTDLQYFVDFELKDRERRKIAAERGMILKREVPTPELYKRHQVGEGVITDSAIGGQYLPVFLKSYVLRGRLDFDVTQVLSKPRQWHGALGLVLRSLI